MSNDFDIGKFRLPETPEASTLLPLPRKIQKRREEFAMVPMHWVEALTKAKASGLTFAVACFVVHRYFKNNDRPFKLANGMLEYDGISRQTKWRALSVLEGLKLIQIDRRSRKSPLVHVR